MMTRRTGFRRLDWLMLPAVLAAAVTTPAHAGPSQATKDRCTAYARRAVEQYRIMKSHPQCQAHTDPLTWQDNYDNHYNGCLLLPEVVTRLTEAGRDNHLQACGAFASGGADTGAANQPPDASGGEASSAAAPQVAVRPQDAAPPPQSAAPEGAAVAPGQSAGVGQSAPASQGVASRGPCPSPQPPLYFQPTLSAQSLDPNPTLVTMGAKATFGPGAITFIEIHRATSATTPPLQVKVTYRVRRPAYWVALLECSHSVDELDAGPWIWISDSGREAKWLAMGIARTITIVSIPPRMAARLLVDVK